MAIFFFGKIFKLPGTWQLCSVVVSFWLFLLVVVVFIIKAVTGGNSGSSASPRRKDSPLDILKERYARGEIDEEEFNRRRIELEK